MDYEATQPGYLPVTDFLELKFHLIDTRQGAMLRAFVTEPVKRWLKAENERLGLRYNAPPPRCGVTDGKTCSCPTGLTCIPVMARK